METQKTVLLIGSSECCDGLRELYQIWEAADTDEGLALLSGHAEELSLLLVDSRIALEHGGGTLSAICQMRNGFDIPVVILGDGLTEEQQQICTKSGANDFLSRQASRTVIRQRLGTLIKLYDLQSLHKRVSADPVTGVYNRPFFMEYMDQRIREGGQSYDLVTLELESYNLLQGRYGTEVCDAFMNGMANGLAGFLPPTTIMGRIDGAHVVFLMPSVPFEMHAEMMKYCIMAGKSGPLPFFMTNAGVYPTVTAEVPAEEAYAGTLLAIDGIRYKHDTYIAQYDDTIRQRMEHRKVLEANMNIALQEKQFQVYYQPKYGIHGAEMHGAEALVRWIHPEMGFMNPGEFIPLFEQNGFIFELDKFILESVCADLRRWMDAGIPVVPVSVNISQTDFDQVKLAFIFEEIVDRYRIPHDLIHFEITETSEAPDALKKSIAVSGFRSRGFSVELDDFGTGYSTLSILKAMPVDVMKIDMSLVRSMFEPAGRAVLEGALFTAIRLKVGVVVEGIENDEQYNTLCEICHGKLEPDIQGFYFSKPLPAVVFEERLIARK